MTTKEIVKGLMGYDKEEILFLLVTMIMNREEGGDQ